MIKQFLSLNTNFNEKNSHTRVATDSKIASDIKHGQVLSLSQIEDIILCLKYGEIPDINKYTVSEISIWAYIRKIILEE